MDLIHDSLTRMGAQRITRTTEGWECQCPICRSSKRSLRAAHVGKNGRPGEFFCHKCDRRGDLVGLVMKAQRMGRNEAEALVREVTPYLKRISRRKDEWERPDISEWAPYRAVCSQYLLDKGYLEEWIWYYEIGFDKWSDELVIPTRDERGDLVGITRRIAVEGEAYYHSEFPKSDYLFGLIQAIRSGETGVYVTEGQSDPLGLAPHVGLPVVSTLGSALSERQAELLARYFTTIIFAYDNDLAGYKGVDNGVPLLRSAGCTDIFVLDYNTDDPGKMPEVDKVEVKHLSYLAWRRVKQRLPKRRKKYHGT